MRISVSNIHLTERMGKGGVEGFQGRGRGGRGGERGRERGGERGGEEGRVRDGTGRDGREGEGRGGEGRGGEGRGGEGRQPGANKQVTIISLDTLCISAWQSLLENRHHAHSWPGVRHPA